MSSSSIRRSAFAIACALSVTILAVRCADSGPLLGPSHRASTPAAKKAVTPAARERAAAARKKVAWMGELHSAVIRDLTKNRKQWLASRGRTKASDCDVAWQIARKYVPRVAEHGEITPKIVAAAEAEAAKHGCKGPSGLEFVIRSQQKSALQFSMFVATARQDGASGAFANYQASLEAAYNNAATPAEVATVTWAVVDQAAADGLGQVDLEILAGLASISVASANDWYTFERGGGFEEDSLLAQMSLFQNGSYWRTVGVCDLLGAFAGAWAGGLEGAIVIGFLASVLCGIALLF